METFQVLAAIMGLLLRFNSPENPILKVFAQFGVFLGAVSTKTVFVPHIIIRKLHDFNIPLILAAYNTAAEEKGCRHLYAIKSRDKDIIFHGFTTTFQQQCKMLQLDNMCVLQLLCEHTGLVFLASDSASAGDEKKLTDKEDELLCNAINKIHGDGSAFITVVDDTL
jgi:hypothetical protein